MRETVLIAHTDRVKTSFLKTGRSSNDWRESMDGNGSTERTPLVSQASESLENISSRAPNVHAYDDDQRAWVRYPMRFLSTTWAVLTSNYVNVLLVFVPAGIVLGALDVNPTATFIVNFLAIVPLAALLSFATEELSVKLGQTIGGLMNATFGNAVELIVCLAWEALDGAMLVYIRKG